MYFLKWLCVFVFGVEYVKSVRNITSHPNWKLVNTDICGVSNSDRIIGGKNASLGAYPWIVQIGYYVRSDPKLKYRCGGTLINELYVITAAHCVKDLPPGYKFGGIRVGEYNTLTNPDCKNDYCADPVQDIKPQKVIVHKKYNNTAFTNDIAIVRLKKPVIFNDNVKPICVPKGRLLTTNFIGKIAEVAGWGIFDINNPKPSTILQTIKLPIVDMEKCHKAFGKFVKFGQGQMCVGGKVGQDSCLGDSGGPLMKVEAVDGPPKYYLIGIVSFGSEHCGAFDYPSIFTEVSKYTTWILNNLKP